VVSRLSSNVIGGKIVGMRLASMVLPAPGGPTSSHQRLVTPTGGRRIGRERIEPLKEPQTALVEELF
jgi:hypothetical protein